MIWIYITAYFLSYEVIMLLLLQNAISNTTIFSVEEGSTVRLPTGEFISPTFDGWTDGEYELIAAPVDVLSDAELLQIERENMTLTFPQMLIGLVIDGRITEAEGEGWLVGTIPNIAMQLVNTLPAQQRFGAKARLLKPQFISRVEPLTGALGAYCGMTDEDLDTFFRTYANV